jgi:glycosyltransferase involved in cell wall biosynthesis
MKVLLVANYLPDRQESMLRFAAALDEGLRAAGVDVEMVRPEPLFGRLRAGPTGLGKWLGYLDKFLVFPPRLHRRAAAADLIHICDHSNGMYVTGTVAARPHLVTCNDMLAVRSALGEFPQNPVRWSGRILQRWIRAGLRRARRLTCISDATRRDVLRLAGHRPEAVSVTYMGQNYPYAPVAEVAAAAEARRRGEAFDATAFARHGLPNGPYLLHVGGDQWYKNRPGVIAMHAGLRGRLGERAPRLVLVGPPVGETDGSGDIETRRGVDNAGLAALYSGAELLLFPSLEEGFGWPIIEAQACGCRVVTTGKDPMREVGGEAACYVADPADIAGAVSTIETLLAQSASARAALIQAGCENAARFSTERMIREYLAIYEEVLRK